MNYKENYYINSTNKNKEAIRGGSNKSNLIKLNIISIKKSNTKKKKD